MILVACLGAGLVLRLASGRSLRDLAHMGLRGETALLVLLAVQVVMPSLRLSGAGATAAHSVWVATFLLLALLAFANREQPGMLVLGVGLVLNFVVIAVNGGMPVLPAAAEVVRGSAAHLSIVPGDFVHVIAGPTTRALWLADVVPLPGPAWLRSLISAGDALLFVGVAVFVARTNVRGSTDAGSDQRTSRNF